MVEDQIFARLEDIVHLGEPKLVDSPSLSENHQRYEPVELARIRYVIDDGSERFDSNDNMKVYVAGREGNTLIYGIKTFETKIPGVYGIRVPLEKIASYEKISDYTEK